MSNHAVLRSTLVLFILGLIMTIPAFAQGATDNSNVCHAINPLHSTYFQQPCASDYDWKVGWCLSQVFQSNMKFVNHTRLDQYDSATHNRYFPKNWKGDPIDYQPWEPREGFYEPLCRKYYRGDKTVADWAGWRFWSPTLNTWMSAERFFRTHPGFWDWYRDYFSVYSTSDPNAYIWVHGRSLSLVKR